MGGQAARGPFSTSPSQLISTLFVLLHVYRTFFLLPLNRASTRTSGRLRSSLQTRPTTTAELDGPTDVNQIKARGRQQVQPDAGSTRTALSEASKGGLLI